MPEAAPNAMNDTINIRNISIKCGNCNTYQTLTAFGQREEWNVYTYESRSPHACRRRDPTWRGGGKHGEIGTEGGEAG
jgi:hypothetical protein